MANQDLDQAIARAAQIAQDADAIIIVAVGAGMGVDSGLSDLATTPPHVQRTLDVGIASTALATLQAIDDIVERAS